MRGIARLGDRIAGGWHCHGHGHTHGPLETPGRIREGSSRVFVDGRPAARAGDHGYSPMCCDGIGDIVLLPSQQKVFIDGRPAIVVDSPTLHCGMAPGQVKGGSGKVNVPGA